MKELSNFIEIKPFESPSQQSTTASPMASNRIEIDTSNHYLTKLIDEPYQIAANNMIKPKEMATV
jgi:hypothetical protein